MRLLLLLLLAAGTAAASPFLAFALRPDLMPPGGDVSQGWQDGVEIARFMLERWRNGEGLDGPDGIGPAGIDEPRLRAALAVGAAVALWLAAFLVGGLVSLPLLRLRFGTLALVALVLAALPASCATLSFQVQASPEEERILSAVILWIFAALASGFLAVQGFRRTTL